MNYLSVKETAVQWGVSTALVRRYCKEGRIPKAVLKEAGWLIPANARKPGSEVVVKKKTELPPLARKLQNQKKKKNYGDREAEVSSSVIGEKCFDRVLAEVKK